MLRGCQVILENDWQPVTTCEGCTPNPRMWGVPPTPLQKILKTMLCAARTLFIYLGLYKLVGIPVPLQDSDTRLG